MRQTAEGAGAAKRSRRNGARLFAAALVTAFAVGACINRGALGDEGADAESAVPGDVALGVSGLRECDYGVGWERPMVVELRTMDEELVARSHHSGMNTGPESRHVWLYARNATPGRYRLHFGFCPALRRDPAASAACEEIEWFRRRSVTVLARGLDQPQVIHVPLEEPRCMRPH